MLTPAGTDCPHYYEDYHRGRSTQECRLVQRSGRSDDWEPRLCSGCPVPAILRANSCPNMILQAGVMRRWFGLARRVRVYAVCREHQVQVGDPFVGCGRCHPEAASVLDRAEVGE